MSEHTPQGYRVNVGAVLWRDQHVLLGQRIDQAWWQFPQGGVQAQETHEQALWRELTEETGLAAPQLSCQIIGAGSPLRYDFPAGYAHPIARRYKGQEQTLFLVRYEGDDDAFDPGASDEPEFGALRWYHVREVEPVIWALKRPIYLALRERYPDYLAP